MGVIGGVGGGALGDWIDRNVFGGSGSTGKALGSALGTFLFPFEQGGLVAPPPRVYEVVGGMHQMYNPNTPLNKGLIGMPNPYSKMRVMQAEKGAMVKPKVKKAPVKKMAAKKRPAKK